MLSILNLQQFWYLQLKTIIKILGKVTHPGLHYSQLCNRGEQALTVFLKGISLCSVATSPVVLRWLCDSPLTGCAWRTTPYIYAARTSSNRVIMACELYYCLLPQCEALRICRSGFPIATKWCCDKDVKVVRSSAFTQRTCDRCGSL